MIRFRLERTIQVRRSSLGVPGRPAGYIMLGVAMIRTATLPRWSGVLVAVGAPAHLLGFGIAQLVTTAAWPIAILGSVCLGAGLSWAGYRLWQTPTTSDVLASD